MSGLTLIVIANTTQWKILFSFISESGRIIAQTSDSNSLLTNAIGLILVFAGIKIYYDEKPRKNCKLD
ncbi:hypothetical protein, partial [Vibrio parahaemolyticus]|uniref:hypothetical protein n=1 Tax=Vibrio parahaemolyticus TaxID=670 RepID=UPI001C5E6238